MKRRVFLLTIVKIAAIILWCGVMALYWGITKKITAVIVVSSAVALSALFVVVLCAALAASPEKSVKMRWMNYYLSDEYHISGDIYYAAEIERVRRNYAEDTDPDRNLIAKPNFAGAKPFCDFSVLKSGKIYYASLIEANGEIFDFSHNIHKVYPIAVVYGTDEYFDSDPAALKEIAEKLFADRARNFLKDETKYFSNIKLSKDLTGGREVYATIIMAYRYHLPFAVLEGDHSVFPIIADPKNSRSAFIVDCKYWSPPLIGEYLGLKDEEYPDPFDEEEDKDDGDDGQEDICDGQEDLTENTEECNTEEYTDR